MLGGITVLQHVRKFGLFIFLFLLFMLVGVQLPWALDPRFDLDLQELRPKTGRMTGAPASEERESAPATPVGARKEESARSKNGGRGRVLTGEEGKAASLSPPKKVRSAGRAVLKKKASRRGLRSSTPVHDRSEVVRWARTAWKRFFAAETERRGPFEVAGANFSLSLDPELYPVLPAMDGGTIIIDAKASLSPFVKTILAESRPDTKVVATDPGNPKKFFAALLDAARFYSVVENFSIDFGTDPKLTVTSDFKVEKTADSLLTNDVVLLNLTGRRTAFPASLVSFLQQEGFHLVDVSSLSSPSPKRHHTVYSIVDGNQLAIVDAILEALSIQCEQTRNIALQDGTSPGVALSLTAERYCEKGARKIVVFSYQNNPVQDVLLELLKRNGYQVVTLRPEDDFREIAEKMLAVLKLSSSYGLHHLWDAREVSFDVQVSGFVVPAAGKGSGRIILTNTVFSPFFKELVGSQGCKVVDK